jgi:hypothetical protein
MSFQNNLFQPGKILNEVIVGCLRARGTNLEDWCRVRGVNRASAMSATFGRSGGPRGQELLAAMIEAAGKDAVAQAYRTRMLEETAKLQRVA